MACVRGRTLVEGVLQASKGTDHPGKIWFTASSLPKNQVFWIQRRGESIVELRYDAGSASWVRIDADLFCLLEYASGVR